MIGHTAELAATAAGINWLVVVGLGCVWLGGQIVWVAPLPRQIRRWLGRSDIPTAEPGTPAAFGLFWIDQYGWIGLSLCMAGVVLALVGGVA